MMEFREIYENAKIVLISEGTEQFKARLLELQRDSETKGRLNAALFFRIRREAEGVSSGQALRLYQQALKDIEQFPEDTEKDLITEMMAINKCVALLGLGRYRETLRACEEIFRKIDTAEKLELRQLFAVALGNKGVALEELGQTEDALAVYDDVVSRCAFSEEVLLRVQVARALANKGAVLGRLDRLSEALTAFGHIVLRFNSCPEVVLRVQVARALVSRGAVLERLGRYGEALTAFEYVASKYGSSCELSLRVQVAEALINRGDLLDELGRAEEALEIYDRVVTSSVSQELILCQLGAMALINKGVALARLGQTENALRAFECVMSECDSSQELLRAQAARALINRGIVLGQLGRIEEELDAYDELYDGFCEWEDSRERELLHQACIWGAMRCVGERKNRFLRRAREMGTPYHRLAYTKGVSTDVVDMIETLAKVFSDKKDNYKDAMIKPTEWTDDFLMEASRFDVDNPHILLTLREWNSYTPAVPDLNGTHRGGGYYIRYRSKGIVVDPGFNFLENFAGAGGRLSDIDYVFITHAHNDHTQDFESLLSLLHTANSRRGLGGLKQIDVFMSVSVSRKFSALMNLRGVPSIRTLEILNAGNPEHPQTISPTGLEGCQVTVLCAYHDDVISRAHSVGLLFEFSIEEQNQKRKILFTSDTGLYASRTSGNGDVVADLGSAPIYDLYPGHAIEPDLLIPHIGSVRARELEDDRFRSVPIAGKGPIDTDNDENAPYFYPNHLGLRGVIMMIWHQRPRMTLLGEFGEELRTIRSDLAKRVGKVVGELSNGPEECIVFLANLLMVYSITDHKLMCHETGTFEAVNELEMRNVQEPECSRYYMGKTYDPGTGRILSPERVYLFKKDSTTPENEAVQDYHRKDWPYLFIPNERKRRIAPIFR